jgi:predicted Zn-dependent peptidase
VRFIGKGTSQTHVRVGHLTIKENDPDYPALSILNDILGGSSFRSRLFQDVRTKQGLAYSVGSSLRAGVREQGVWLMRAETKSESTHDVISRLVANMERLREQPVTDAELAEAKEAFVNSFVFSFTSPSSIVARLIGLEYDGLPKDFLQQLRDQVVKLTKEDLLRAARAHLHPDRIKILAVGPAEALPRVLSGFGEVKEIKLVPEG